MNKVFRLYNEGDTSFQDWNETPVFPYNKGNRAEDKMPDPDGASAAHEITSIPSPFARIDLVKTAFAEVCAICKKGNRTDVSKLDGDTIFHKMVSDSLDVGELFFNYSKLKDKLEIITWNPRAMLDEMDTTNDAGQQIYSQALRKYMLSDAKTYNFDLDQNFYLLNYINGPQQLNIIGATSTATLFFSTANKIDFIKDVSFGQDKPFDDDYQPLYKRDAEYLLAFFYYKNSIPNFSTLFPEVNDYLSITFQALQDQALKNKLNNVGPGSVTHFVPITTLKLQQQNDVEVLGNKLLQKGRPIVQSQFCILSQKQTEAQVLVLPVESGNKYAQLQYTTDVWGTTNRAPYQDDEKDYKQRILPADGSPWPFLTISDFLEENIIAVAHRLNNDEYFDGGIKLAGRKLSYLLPIKPLFFEFFTVDELKGQCVDGKPMFEMELLAGDSIAVTLRIPIKGNQKIHYIEYNRTYCNHSEPNIEENQGGVREFDFTAIMTPHLRFTNSSDAIYRVACVSTISKKFQLEFYEDGTRLQGIACECRNTLKSEQMKSDTYLIERQNFDFFRISDGHTANIILPLFREQREIDTFEFAVDLGTSNTHIEFKKEGNVNSEVLSFKDRDQMISHLFLPSFIPGTTIQDDLRQENELIEKDFLPNNIGADSDFHFPTRTVLSYGRETDWNQLLLPLGKVNIPLTYEKRKSLQYNDVKYNIKWGDINDQRTIEVYIECLMLLIRNKVLLNNGRLYETKITWFYPISMAPKRLTKLQQAWDAAYARYFNGQGTTPINESEAPIHYYFRKYSTATNLVNVDIGGGTTDIAFSQNKNILHVTSFRFASNNLFENPYADADTENGIVDIYKERIRNLLEGKDLGELIAILDSENNRQPSNMASFLFSLKYNSRLKGKLDPKTVDFNALLQSDDDFRIVFIIYYSAIIYHIAKIVKAKGLQLPRHIAFSGNGSKVIQILTTNNSLLSKFTKIIFEGVLGHPYEGELDILGFEQDNNPKESTCKGGLLGKATTEDMHDRIIILKSANNTIVTADDTYDMIDVRYKRNVIQQVEEFFDFILNTVNQRFNYDDHFGVSNSSLQLARQIAHADLMTFLEKGIAQRKEESDGKNRIEETFFYYPIKGVINELTKRIAAVV